MTEMIGRIVVRSGLPTDFPTHLHAADFWESLGRTVATFGLLEEVLCKAIFAFTATRPYSDAEANEAYDRWLPTLQRALSDQLGGLIETYGKAVREHPNANVSNLSNLLDDLRAASKIRNVLCHGSWRRPNQNGASIPFFINRQNECFETPIDKVWLEQTRQHVVTLICIVISTVTHMGWQFPGSTDPGVPIWNTSMA